MFQVRIHGRGGQGVVTAAEMLSVAAFDEGRHAQAFPSFGSERTGAPVVAFCRIDDKEIRLREPIMEPDAIIIQDPTLLHQVDVFAGLKKNGFILINTSKTFDQLGLGDFLREWRHERLCTVPAMELALKHVGRPVPNVPLLGGFAAVAGVLQLESVIKAIEERFSGKVAEGNVAAAREAYAIVKAEMQEAIASAGQPQGGKPPTGGQRVGFTSVGASIMLKQMEGSRAVAEAVALCRPEVICAYPISPQTHIVEALGEMVKDGTLSPCEFINVESEFAAMSVAIGSSAAGARSYTATASQGLLFMAEAVYNASGLGLPIVMTVANRAIGSPINIWNDHSDALSQRDSGWLQLFAETNQEALDLHIQAFRLAEELSLPVMVCMDGFILTHAYERVDMPTQEQVDAYLPQYEPRQVLDPSEPVSIGAMVGPEAFMEVRYLAHAKQMEALELIPSYAAEFKAVFGRDSGGLTHTYRTEDAETIIVAMGSVLGTIKDVIDEMREAGHKIGVLGLTLFRPFPLARVREGLQNAKRVVVLEKSMAVGLGGILSTNVRMALSGLHMHGYTVVAGLGGRAITKKSLHALFRQAEQDALDNLTFLDLDWNIVNKQLEREKAHRRSGPVAENLLRDVGVVAARNY
ncbi:2-oxoacid:acceptor oxidoreductase family protein [Sulfuritalea hydrogenivorans]|nr:2-oxoacid:acceptor oxidoreductase family protein [Sulfuritalea hydrogenivorans]